MTANPMLPPMGRTALGLAAERHWETSRVDRLFADPLAEAFLHAAAAHGTAPRPRPGRAGVRHASDTLRGFFSLRTWWFDQRALDAARTGCRQVVLLGAGLDTRAFRLNWPADTRVFELDDAEVLAFKNHVLATQQTQPRCFRTCVPTDLATTWSTDLTAAGFDPTRPTVWLAEGLLIYLDVGELDRLLETITTLSARHSRLVLEHCNAALPQLPVMQDMAQRRAALGIVQKSSLEDPEQWLAGHGWHAELADPALLAAQTGRQLPTELNPQHGATARIWLATATPTTTRSRPKTQ